ncbi:MAG: hypothetical protein WAM28_02245 [Chlamydiales bacterium]
MTFINSEFLTSKSVENPIIEDQHPIESTEQNTDKIGRNLSTPPHSQTPLSDLSARALQCSEKDGWMVINIEGDAPMKVMIPETAAQKNQNDREEPQSLSAAKQTERAEQHEPMIPQRYRKDVFDLAVMFTNKLKNPSRRCTNICWNARAAAIANLKDTAANLLKEARKIVKENELSRFEEGCCMSLILETEELIDPKAARDSLNQRFRHLNETDESQEKRSDIISLANLDALKAYEIAKDPITRLFVLQELAKTNPVLAFDFVKEREKTFKGLYTDRLFFTLATTLPKTEKAKILYATMKIKTPGDQGLVYAMNADNLSEIDWKQIDSAIEKTPSIPSFCKDYLILNFVKALISKDQKTASHLTKIATLARMISDIPFKASALCMIFKNQGKEECVTLDELYSLAEQETPGSFKREQVYLQIIDIYRKKSVESAFEVITKDLKMPSTKVQALQRIDLEKIDQKRVAELIEDIITIIAETESIEDRAYSLRILFQIPIPSTVSFERLYEAM